MYDDVDSLSVLHEIAEKTLEATREKEESLGVLFVVCTLHEVTRMNSAAPLETENV